MKEGNIHVINEESAKVKFIQKQKRAEDALRVFASILHLRMPRYCFKKINENDYWVKVFLEMDERIFSATGSGISFTQAKRDASKNLIMEYNLESYLADFDDKSLF